MKLKVQGLDNLTATPIVFSTTTSAEENDHKEKREEKHKHNKYFLTTYSIEDEAGNTLTLTFKKLKQRKHEIKAELTTLQYNNNPVITLPKTTLKYEWSINKKIDQIKELEQKIKAKRQFEVKAKYCGKKDSTLIKAEQNWFVG